MERPAANRDGEPATESDWSLPVAERDRLAARLRESDDRISQAASAAGRLPSDITRIVVTKFHPAALVRALVELGVTDVGENRHQEAQAKALELAGMPITWHYIGQLQSKKARQVRAYADSIHSVDRLQLVDLLASAEGPVRDIFLQVNLTDDPGRGGAAPDDLEALAEHAESADGLRLRGVMAVAPLDAEPRRAFATLRTYSDRVRKIAPRASDISAGMSQDFAEAIAEGATHLRIGSAITGNRPVHG